MVRSELVAALKLVMAGIGDKNVLLEGSTSFMFDDEWIKTFNDEISVSYPFKTGIKCLVKAQEFFSILSKMKLEDVKMFLLDNGRLQLSCGKTSLKMTSLDISLLAPLVNNLALENIDWKPLPDNFLKALNICAGFASTNNAFSTLCGISIGKDGLMASDQIRAIFYRLPIKIKESFFLRIGSIKELVKFEDITEFFIGESWVHFKDKNGVYFSIRKYNIDFPRDTIKKFINFSNIGPEYKFPEQLIHSLDLVSVMAFTSQGGNPFVSISLDDKGNLIISGAKEFGNIKEKIIKNDSWSFPENSKIQINPSCLSSLLSSGLSFFIKDGRFLLMKNGDIESAIALIVEG